MKLFGGEVASVLSIAIVTASVVLAVPPEALRFAPSAAAAVRRPVCASVSFVELSAETEVELVRLVKDAWRKGSGQGRIYADLTIPELPEAKRRPILSFASRSRPPRMSSVACEAPPYLPSQRAEEPAVLPISVRTDETAFSREELLQIK